MKFFALILACAVSLPFHSHSAEGPNPEPRWWKGNLHTHSLWSDGDDFPEVIAKWYKEQGYHFLAISDHNTMGTGIRWVNAQTNRLVLRALPRYVEKFGGNWVELRETNGVRQVRLKPFNEYRTLLDEPQRFLLIPSEEITDRHGLKPVHMNVTNPRDHIPPSGGNSVLEVMQNNVNAVLKQRAETGQAMFPHLNHPNFVWGVTAEELMQVQGEKFFEVYNGHPQVNNEGDARRPSTDRMWDIMLAYRLTLPEPEIMYGIGVDDSHHYFDEGPGRSTSGRGWVMVKTRFLTPEHIVHAMEAGDFYASSGVQLEDLKREGKTISLRIAGEAGVSYRTQFIGARKGALAADATSDEAKQALGAILAESEGLAASYTFKGDELYVRAKIISTKPKKHPAATNEVECAWTQPELP